MAKMAESKAAMDDVADSGGSSFDKLSAQGGVMAAALGGALVAVGGIALDLGMKYQTSTAQLAASAGISIKAADDIGNAFLSTAGQLGVLESAERAPPDRGARSSHVTDANEPTHRKKDQTCPTRCRREDGATADAKTERPKSLLSFAYGHQSPRGDSFSGALGPIRNLPGQCVNRLSDSGLFVAGWTRPRERPKSLPRREPPSVDAMGHRPVTLQTADDRGEGPKALPSVVNESV
jgi:hypothetical protein